MRYPRHIFMPTTSALADTARRVSATGHKNRESGAITIAETMIALAAGTAIILTWLMFQAHRQEVQQAQLAGRTIAAYAGAVARWLGEDPPTTAGTYGIADLQDCASATGVRFLPCAYGTDTTIPYIGGTGVTLGSLEIVVTLPAQGPMATVDFGVFRHGDDENDDGLPDSRPDLAAIALARAQEESAPGVFGYFELAFARDDLTGLVTDPNDSAFDLAELDNLARVQATTGANLAAPFLKTDGSNSMTGSITFNNGVQFAMASDGLQVTATGDVDFEADVTMSDVTVDKMDVEEVDVSKSLAVTPADGVSGEGFTRLDQSSDVASLTTDVSELRSDLTEDISENTTTLGSHKDRIKALEDQIADLSPGDDPPTCTPSSSQKRTEYSKLGYSIYFDHNTSTGNCSNSGSTCQGKDKCGDTVRGTIQRRSAHSDNPVIYSGRDPADLKCADYSISFYKSCGCVIQEPSGCQ